MPSVKFAPETVKLPAVEAVPYVVVSTPGLPEIWIIGEMLAAVAVNRMLSNRLLPPVLVALVNMTLTKELLALFNPVTNGKERTPELAKLVVKVPATAPFVSVPIADQFVPFVLCSQTCELKPELVLCADSVMPRLEYPAILNLNTATLELVVRLISAIAAGVVVFVDNPLLALTAVPANALSSLLVVAEEIQLLAPLLPLR